MADSALTISVIAKLTFITSTGAMTLPKVPLTPLTAERKVNESPSAGWKPPISSTLRLFGFSSG